MNALECGPSSQWLFPRSALFATPSGTTSSIPLEKELYDRARGVEFLFRLGSSLQLPTTALFTAATWFHRFYMRNSLEDYHRQDVAASCIFLATKTEECGRKLRDVARVCQSKASAVPAESLSDEEVERCQEAILLTEEALLEALCFDFVVTNPHEVLVDLFNRHTPLAEDNEDQLKDLAWSIAHDSFRTILCLLFDVRIISAACFIIAQRVLGGEHSPSLSSRISSTSAASSLPTPPTNKPTSPDASRFVVEQLQFSDEELAQLAQTMTILTEFYGAQDVIGTQQYLLAVSTIPPPIPALPEDHLYAPLSHVAKPDNANISMTELPTQAVVNSSQRTPDSSHGESSPVKSSSSGWKAVKSSSSSSNALVGSLSSSLSRPRLDLS